VSTNRKTRSDSDNLRGFKRLEKFHPFKTFMFFGLVGSTVLFLSMVFLYFVAISRAGNPVNFQLPKAFSVSTIFLIISSYSISGAVKAFKNDSFDNLKFSLVTTLLSSSIFCVFQVFGWIKLSNAGFFINSNVGVAYLYVITGMHLLHVVGGMFFLIYLSAIVFSKSGDIVKALMYFTDDLQLTRLQLATIYWHFVDALWVLLFFMFLFTF
jgi:cytochrome c oxidase subunit III